MGRFYCSQYTRSKLSACGREVALSNTPLQPTASSVRSYVAPAFGSN